MPKSNAVKKASANNRKVVTKKAAKKPNLKVVKSGTAQRAGAKKTNKPKLKAVKPAAKKVKPVAKKVAKPVAKKAVAAMKKPALKARPVIIKSRETREAAVSTMLAKKVEAKKLAAKKAISNSRAGVSLKKDVKPIANPIVVGKSGQGFAANMNKNRTQIMPKSMSAPAKKAEFKVGSYVVYPTHGVGKIIAEEIQEIGEVKLSMFVINFEKDKMTLRVPKHRAEAAGLRHVSGNSQMQKMFDTLKGKAKTSRGMWSRRAQEYEAKINSGCVMLIAEVVRDLHQNVDQAERSYSERMIYESAFGRLAGELAASERMEHNVASEKLLKLLRAKKAA